MPVGVEHLMCASRSAVIASSVPLPLMPVGVEHSVLYTADTQGNVCAFTFDACRR